MTPRGRIRPRHGGSFGKEGGGYPPLYSSIICKTRHTTPLLPILPISTANLSPAGRRGLRSLPLFWRMLHGLYPAPRPARPSRPPFKAVLQREDRRDQPGGNHKGVQAAEEAPRLAAKPPPNTTPNARGRHKKGNGKVKANGRQTTLPRIHSRQSSGSKETPFPLRELGQSPASPSLRTRPAVRRAGTRPPTGKTELGHEMCGLPPRSPVRIFAEGLTRLHFTSI